MSTDIIKLRGSMLPAPTPEKITMLARAYGSGLSRRRAAAYAGITDANLQLWFKVNPELERELQSLQATTMLEHVESVLQKAEADPDPLKHISVISKIFPDFTEKTYVEHSFNEDHGKLEVVFRKDWPSG